MIEKAIKNFPKQFSFDPVVENGGNFKKLNKFVVVGMGGSGLAGELLKAWKPDLDLIIHKNYGLPTKDLEGRLIILNSYSGNTEEVIDAFERALGKKLPMAAISIGGKLLELAKKNSILYIQLPDTGIQPRSALGFSFKALLKLVGGEADLKAIEKLVTLLKAEDYQEPAKVLAKKLKNKIPIIYSSERNQGISYNWKVKLNEGGKIPAFTNVFPELNHNEMIGFGKGQNFNFIFLRDLEDHPRIIKRMEVLKKIFQDKGLLVEILELTGKTRPEKIFSNSLLADWTAYYIAKEYNKNPEKVPLVEKFKKLIK